MDFLDLHQLYVFKTVQYAMICIHEVFVCLFRVSSNLENLEYSGNFILLRENLENSGNNTDLDNQAIFKGIFLNFKSFQV